MYIEEREQMLATSCEELAVKIMLLCISAAVRISSSTVAQSSNFFHEGNNLFLKSSSAQNETFPSQKFLTNQEMFSRQINEEGTSIILTQN